MKKEEGFMTQLDPFQFGLGLKTSWTRVNLLSDPKFGSGILHFLPIFGVYLLLQP